MDNKFLQTKFPTILLDITTGSYHYQSKLSGTEIKRSLDCETLSEARRRANALELVLNKPDKSFLDTLRITID